MKHSYDVQPYGEYVEKERIVHQNWQILVPKNEFRILVGHSPKELL